MVHVFVLTLALALHLFLARSIVWGFVQANELSIVQSTRLPQEVPLTKEKPAIIDVTLYNGDPVALYRLEYLKDVVDLFVIVESYVTFSGIKKPKIYLRENEPILNELRTANRLMEIEIQDIPLPKTYDPVSRRGYNATIEAAWLREKYSRGVALESINARMGKTPFILIACDTDEIPRKEMVAQFAAHYHYIGDGKRLAMSNHVYSFKWVLERALRSGGSEWVFPFVITDIGLKEWKASHGFELAELRVNNIAMSLMPYILNAGWHCSYCSSIEDVIMKITSFSHQELNRPKFKDPEWIKTCMRDGKDLFMRSDTTFPINEYRCNAGIPQLTGNAMKDALSRYPYLNINYCQERFGGAAKASLDLTFPPNDVVINHVTYSRGDVWPIPPHPTSYSFSSAYSASAAQNALHSAQSIPRGGMGAPRGHYSRLGKGSRRLSNPDTLFPLKDGTDRAACQGNLLVAGATNYGFREIRTFILSYNASGTATHSTLLMIFKEAQRADVTLTSFLSLFKAANVQAVYVDPINKQHIGNFRFKWLLDFLQTQQGQSYCNVASLDTRDVYFQSDFFREIEAFKAAKQVPAGSDYVLLAKEGGGEQALHGKPMNTCPWHKEAAERPCVQPLIQDYTSFMTNSMLCSGTITGTPSGLVVLFSLMHEAMSRISEDCMKMSMTDQIVMNIVAYESAITRRSWISEANRALFQRLNVLIPSNYENPMLTLGHVPVDDFTVTVHGSGKYMVVELLPSVNKYRAGGVPGLVHQYDRYEWLGKRLRYQLQAAKGQKYGDSEKEKRDYRGPPRLFGQ